MTGMLALSLPTGAARTRPPRRAPRLEPDRDVLRDVVEARAILSLARAPFDPARLLGAVTRLDPGLARALATLIDLECHACPDGTAIPPHLIDGHSSG